MTAVQDLSKCNPEEIRTFLDSFHTVLTDCDGVLWNITAPIDGAVQSVKKLRDLGKRIFFVTNNNIGSIGMYCKRFERMGLPVSPDQLVLPSKVICWYLKKINFQGVAHVIGSTAFRQYLSDNGIKMTEPDLAAIENDIPGTIELLRDRASVNAVICDVDIHCNWMKMNLAVNCLKRKDVLFLTGALDEHFPLDNSTVLIGPGPITKIISEHSDRKPIECSKPSEVLRNYIIEECGVSDPKRCIFIGDTIKHDMKFATLAGFAKLFVGTGVDSIENAAKADDCRPDYYLPSLGLLSNILENVPRARVANGDNR